MLGDHQRPTTEPRSDVIMLTVSHVVITPPLHPHCLKGKEQPRPLGGPPNIRSAFHHHHHPYYCDRMALKGPCVSFPKRARGGALHCILRDYKTFSDPIKVNGF